MRFADLLALAFSALWQQKFRTWLTMAGVVIGTFVLVVSLSLGRGFEREVMHQLSRGALTRQIMVWPGTGVQEKDIPPEKLVIPEPMSEAKRQRIRQAKIRRWKERKRGIQLNKERLRKIQDFPHVETAVPLIKKPCLVLKEGQKPRSVLAFAANADNPHFRNRILAGEYFHSDTGRAVVVSEFLVYLWGITRDNDVGKVLGQKIRLEYRKEEGGVSPALLQLLHRSKLDPTEMKALEKLLWGRAASVSAGKLVFAEEFTIVGVLREFIDDQDTYDFFDLGAGATSEDADIYLPSRTAAELFGRGEQPAGLGFPGVLVTVDAEKNVKDVVHQVRSLGLQGDSLQETAQKLQTYLVLATFTTAFLAAVALLVAALGITNTMTMTVLERVREIGVMKAVGAHDRHIQLIFLVEGALIGAIGGALGVFLGWLASFPGDAIAQALLQELSLNYFKDTLFVFPPWLTVGAPAFACLVTTAAAVYPARRATRVNPITALRHE
jgi:putative ABC transport system permease protein